MFIDKPTRASNTSKTVSPAPLPKAAIEAAKHAASRCRTVLVQTCYDLFSAQISTFDAQEHVQTTRSFPHADNL
jgi:hypothetical protein